MIRAVVFDMDGLMLNTEEVYVEADRELLRRRRIELTKQLNNEMMGLRPQATFELMIHRCGLRETWQELAEERARLFVGMLPGRLSPMPGLMPFLDALERSGIPKAIATSTDRKLAEISLAPFDLAKRFRIILTAEDVTNGKPHPEIYLTASRQFGVPPSEMMVLEDSQNGCRAASAAGAFVVAVPGAHSRGQDFSPAHLVVESLADPRLYGVMNITTKTA
jgi:HAD superfamily hydrolase (TIGR01509 family)